MITTTCLIGVSVCRLDASKVGTSGCTVATLVSLGEGVVCATASAVHATSSNSSASGNLDMWSRTLTATSGPTVPDTAADRQEIAIRRFFLEEETGFGVALGVTPR